jgi:hypothetical protein
MAVVPMDLITAVFHSAIYSLMVFILPISLMVSALASIASAVSGAKTPPPIVALATFSVIFSALIVGYMTGSSREAVSGDVLPVVMSGFGALATYSAIKGAIPISVACGLVILISAGLLTGTLLGAAFREYGPPNFQAVQPPPDYSGEIQS